MRRDDSEEPEVFTISEIARAAGVTPSDVRWTIALDRIPTFQRTFVPFDAAVSLVHRLRTGSPGGRRERLLFAPMRRAGIPSASFAPGEESPFVIKVPVAGVASRYRVRFRGADGAVIAHVDRRPDAAAAATTSLSGGDPWVR